MRKINLEGCKFNKLLVKADSTKRAKSKDVIWTCICECGAIVDVTAFNLKSGNTKSCGCHRVKHNMTHTKTYSTWEHIIQRCTNPNNDNWHKYGSRGITVCDEWLLFKNFLKDMGERPENTSLDRIDNNKGYYKENCRWADVKTQARNTRKNKLTIEKVEELRRLRKEGKSIAALSREFSLSYGYTRLVILGNYWG